MQHTVDMLAILSSFYERVYMTKPQTSRYANSEKYIVCKGFLFENSREFYHGLHKTFEQALLVDDTKQYITRFLTVPISSLFLSKLQEYNAIFGQQQIETIYYTISLIENKFKADKIDNLINTNIQKCVNWCIKYDVSYNVMSTPQNIFRVGEPTVQNACGVLIEPASRALPPTTPSLNRE